MGLSANDREKADAALKVLEEIGEIILEFALTE